MRYSGKIYCIENWPQMPDVSSTKRWLSSIFLQKEVHTVGLQAHTHAHQTPRARTGAAIHLCVLFPQQPFCHQG